MTKASYSGKGITNLRERGSYVYDYRGLLVKKTYQNYNPSDLVEVENEEVSKSVTEFYEYTADGRVIYNERSEENDTKQTIYIWANTTLWCEINGGVVYYHHTDHLCTTEVVTDSSGAVVWEAGYEAFGSVLSERGESKFTPSYTGKFFDNASGLYYFNARWYDSELGKFTTSDPIRDGLNWWNYCNGNPITNFDWQGLSSTRDDFAYQIRTQSEKNTVDYYNSYNQEIDYALQNQGYSILGKWNNLICPQIDKSLGGLFNLDFGQDFLESSNIAAQNKQYFTSFMYKLDAIGESIIDCFVAYKSAEDLGTLFQSFKEQFSKENKSLQNTTVERKPYSKGRPPYAKGQVETVWENAKDPYTGKVLDPSGREIVWDKTKPRNGQWDMGHIPNEKYSTVHKEYMDGNMALEEFKKWYQDPNNYRPELPGTNRNHKFE